MSSKHLAYRTGWALLASSGLGLLLYSYNVKLCFRDQERPIFGEYTIHCVWDGQIKGVHVYRLGSTKKPDLDIISGYIVARMAKRVAAQETARAGPLQTNAEIDARVYGKFFPCDIAVVAMEFSNPSVPNPKPRFILNAEKSPSGA